MNFFCLLSNRLTNSLSERYNTKQLMDVVFAVGQYHLGNLEWGQKGLRATRKPRVTLARYRESQIHHFHRTLDMYLYGENGRR